MDEKDQFLARRLGARNLRSRALRPHTQLIAELRSRGFRYADIAAWLTEKQNVPVTASAVAKHCQRAAASQDGTSAPATALAAQSFDHQAHQLGPQEGNHGKEDASPDPRVPDSVVTNYGDDRQSVAAESGTDTTHGASHVPLPTFTESPSGTSVTVQPVRPADRYSNSFDDEQLDITSPEFIAARQAVRRRQ